MTKLYTTHCPNCKALEKMLQTKGIEYEAIEDKDTMVEVGRKANILSAPILEVDGTFYKFADALKYLRNL